VRELLSDSAMDMSAASRARKKGRAGREGEAKSKQILVIEDDRSIVELIREIVSLLGFGVIAAENADEAITEFEECSDSAACVILDYGIPGMDASRLLSRLREINSSVKVVLSSGYSQSFIAREFPLDTVAAFIAKPYEPQILVDALTKVVEGTA
jgi:two-component system, cell cycle sensor histidine kinase and response regulator CckA